MAIVYRLAANYGFRRASRTMRSSIPIAPGRGTTVGRTALEGRTVHIPDVLADPEYTARGGQSAAVSGPCSACRCCARDVPIGVIIS